MSEHAVMSDYAVVNPATGEQIKTYPTITDDELQAAITKAYETHDGWLRSTTVAERAALHPPRRRAALGAARGARRDHRPRDGQADRAGAGRSGLSAASSTTTPTRGRLLRTSTSRSRRRLALIRRTRRACSWGSCRRTPALSGGAICGAEPADGQPRTAEARPAVHRNGRRCRDLLDARLSGGRYVNLFAPDQIADLIADPRVHGCP